MANDRNEVTRMNWGEIFAFTRVFKSGSLARNISMLALALAGILLICATGWVLDNVASLTGQTVLDGEMMVMGAPPEGAGEMPPAMKFSEIKDYARLTPAKFAARKEAYLKARPRVVALLRAAMVVEAHSFGSFMDGMAGTDARGRALHSAMGDIIREKVKKDEKWTPPDLKKLLKEAEEKPNDWPAALRKAKEDAANCIEGIEDLIVDASEKAQETINGLTEKKSEARDHLAEDRITALRQLTQVRTEFNQAVTSISGKKIFDTFITYEGRHLKLAVCALLSGNISSGLSARLSSDPARVAETDADPGFIVEMMLVVAGVKWLFVEHWLYGCLLVLAALAIWALFGGAMHRVAALQAGREEKISLFEALRFARSRFLSFFFAPLMPLAFVLFLGLLLMLGGLLANIPWIGPFIVGVMFIFALLLGLAIAFLMIGLLAGAGLMYPTIAVEGSDCFDAMSRSFTYVFSRPWRAALYAVAALVHGAICYVFVRFFAFLALAMTHWFVKGAVWTGGESLPTTATASPDKIDVLWTAPSFGTLHTWNWEAMSAAQGFGALLIMAWVYLVIGLVAAFALGYFTGGMTMIYYLLRREVDATEFDEVYVSEAEDEPLLPAESEAEGAQAPEEEAPDEEAPDEEAPAEEAPDEEAPEEAPAEGDDEASQDAEESDEDEEASDEEAPGEDEQDKD